VVEEDGASGDDGEGFGGAGAHDDDGAWSDFLF